MLPVVHSLSLPTERCTRSQRARAMGLSSPPAAQTRFDPSDYHTPSALLRRPSRRKRSPRSVQPAVLLSDNDIMDNVWKFREPDEASRVKRRKLADASLSSVGVQCCVCGGSQSTECNHVVSCRNSGCSCTVHQKCYYVPDPCPEWLCEVCEQSGDKTNQETCLLCPIRGGALRRNKDGHFVHVACGMFLPELWYDDTARRKGLDMSFLDHDRTELTCMVCLSKQGACVPCAVNKCDAVFHITCALSVGGFLIREHGSFCRAHQHKAQAQLAAQRIAKHSQKLMKKKVATDAQSSLECLGIHEQYSASDHSRRGVLRAQRNKYAIRSSSRSFFPIYVWPRATCWKEALTVPIVASDNLRADQNRCHFWKLHSTTDESSKLAHDVKVKLAPQWSSYRELSRYDMDRITKHKTLGYSALYNPSNEMIGAAQWAVWELPTRHPPIPALNVRYFLTEERSRRAHSQRRKCNGTLLMAHILEVGFDLGPPNNPVEWATITSEPGAAYTFWRKLGFRDVEKDPELRRRIPKSKEAELNEYANTRLLVMTRQDRAFLQSRRHPVSSMDLAFSKWAPRHRECTRPVKFKANGRSFHCGVYSLYCYGTPPVMHTTRSGFAAPVTIKLK